MRKDEFDITIGKFKEYNHIKNSIDLDSTLDFWGKSTNYINEIKIQLQKEEYGKLLTLYKKLNDIIKNAYLSNTPTIIITYDPRFIEIGLGIWLYYFNTNASLSFDAILKLMNYKIIGNIQLSDNLKRFFMLITANTANTTK